MRDIENVDHPKIMLLTAMLIIKALRVNLTSFLDPRHKNIQENLYFTIIINIFGPFAEFLLI